MAGRLAGKRILVTAAGAGIGRATVLMMAKEGASVVATDVKPELLASLAGVPGIETRKLDVLDDAEVAAVVGADLVYARRLGLDATPAICLNGRYISGFRGTEELAADVDTELAHARARIAAGVARDAVAREILEREAIPASEFPSADLQQ